MFHAEKRVTALPQLSVVSSGWRQQQQQQQQQRHQFEVTNFPASNQKVIFANKRNSLIEATLTNTTTAAMPVDAARPSAPSIVGISGKLSRIMTSAGCGGGESSSLWIGARTSARTNRNRERAVKSVAAACRPPTTQPLSSSRQTQQQTPQQQSLLMPLRREQTTLASLPSSSSASSTSSSSSQLGHPMPQRPQAVVAKARSRPAATVYAAAALPVHLNSCETTSNHNKNSSNNRNSTNNGMLNKRLRFNVESDNCLPSRSVLSNDYSKSFGVFRRNNTTLGIVTTTTTTLPFSSATTAADAAAAAAAAAAATVVVSGADGSVSHTTSTDKRLPYLSLMSTTTPPIVSGSFVPSTTAAAAATTAAGASALMTTTSSSSTTIRQLMRDIKHLKKYNLQLKIKSAPISQHHCLLGSALLGGGGVSSSGSAVAGDDVHSSASGDETVDDYAVGQALLENDDEYNELNTAAVVVPLDSDTEYKHAIQLPVVARTASKTAVSRTANAALTANLAPHIKSYTKSASASSSFSSVVAASSNKTVMQRMQRLQRATSKIQQQLHQHSSGSAIGIDLANTAANGNASTPLTQSTADIAGTAAAAASQKQTRRRSLTLTQRSKTVPMIRFRKMVRLVRILQDAVSSIKSRSSQNRKLEELQVSNKRSGRENSTVATLLVTGAGGPTTVAGDAFTGMIFDVNQFKRVKETTLSDDAARLLRLAPEKRTDEHVKVVMAALIDSVPEFQDFPIEMQKKIIRVAILQTFEKGRIVIRQNHRADNFYFIVSGITIVSVTESNAITGDVQNRVVAYLSKGKSFGELAIMHGATRNATVTCHTDVAVLSIGRDDFIDIFMHVERGQEPEHISFLRKIELLRDWPIELLPYNQPRVCLLTYFRKGVLMCKDSNKNDWIYFVKQGSCRIIKDIKLVRQSNITFLKRPLDVPDRFYDFHSHNSKYANDARKEMDHQKRLKQNYDRLSNTSAYQENGIADQKSVFIEIKKLVSRDIFGLVDVLYSDFEGANSVTLVSDGAECILLNKKLFLKHLTESKRKNLKDNIQPYPSEFDLQKKYQISRYWQRFKKNALKPFYATNVSHKAETSLV